MKTFLFLIILLCNLKLYALSNKKFFGCKSPSDNLTHFSIQYEGPRYADWIRMKIMSPDLDLLQNYKVSKLINSRPNNFNLQSISLTSALAVGSCQLGTTENLLISCETESEKSWSMTEVNFSYLNEGNLNSSSRDLNVKKMKLKVLRRDLLLNYFEVARPHAILKLEMIIDQGNGQFRTLEFSSILGSLENDECRFY